MIIAMDMSMEGTNVDSLREYIILKIVMFSVFDLKNCLSFVTFSINLWF